MDTLFIAQRQQRLIWGAATLLIALLGLAQRDQRGLLSGVSASPISAFAAITPQAPGALLSGRGGTGRGARPDGGRLGPSRGVTGPQFAAGTGDTAPATGTTPSVFDAQDPAATPSALLALADPASGAGINPGPGVGSNLPGISPGGPQQTVSSGAAPGAVPEAPMWAIMILGVGGIGCMARRERSRGRSLLQPRHV